MDIQTLRSKHPEHWDKSTAIRILALDAVAKANSGHSGMPMGMADVATVLFEKHLKFVAKDPKWHDRDRFILSAGHGSMLLYSVLHLCGYEEFPIDELKKFRQLGSKTAGHPENFLATAIETTTGPLGQGISNAVGFAMAEELLRARFGKQLVNHKTYVIAGDGCLMEGISQEAISLAGRYNLSQLILLWDNNNITIDGKVDLVDRTDQVARFKASGWHVLEIDGHNPIEIDEAIGSAKKGEKPTMISCKTHIAFGSFAQDTPKGHGALTDPELISAARQNYGWTHNPFEIPKHIKKQWESIGKRGQVERDAWVHRLRSLSLKLQKEFERVHALEPAEKIKLAVIKLKKEASRVAPKVATRKSSEMALNVINPIAPETFGGSADLSGSNNTKSTNLENFDINNRSGRYMHWGIREHAMAAAMNGMALHGGVRPYGGTFMCFTDYARPSMRLAALMQIPTVFVMTHDSIGLGEDGPTHQPVEHLAISRATPNTYVFRPADTVETAEAWQIALSTKKTPSVLALSRQGVPTVRVQHKRSNLSEKGAYVLAEADGKKKVVLISTGSEVYLALEARTRLQEKGIGTRVVSMPCMELFSEQDKSYRRSVLLSGRQVRVAVEAGVRQGWDRWLLGEGGIETKTDFIGMSGFGASAPAQTLFNHFGITTDRIVERVEALL